MEDLNLRPPRCERGALTAELTAPARLKGYYSPARAIRQRGGLHGQRSDLGGFLHRFTGWTRCLDVGVWIPAQAGMIATLPAHSSLHRFGSEPGARIGGPPVAYRFRNMGTFSQYGHVMSKRGRNDAWTRHNAPCANHWVPAFAGMTVGNDCANHWVLAKAGMIAGMTVIGAGLKPAPSMLVRAARPNQ